MQTLRQISFGLLDMSWHGYNPKNINNVKVHELEAFKHTNLYPDVAENCMSTSFSHIFQGGYSSGYYSYKWAEVLDADAFAYFQEHGIFSSEIAQNSKPMCFQEVAQKIQWCFTKIQRSGTKTRSLT